MLNKDFPSKLFNFFGFIVLLVASILSFILDPCPITVIPFPQISIPIINSLSALFSLYLFFFKPNLYIGQCTVLIVQSVTTTLTGYEILGTFLFFAAILILFCEGFFKTNLKEKIYIIVSFWFITTLGIIPFGWARFVLALAVFLFFFGFYIFLYSKLKDLLSTLLPPDIVTSYVNLPSKGTHIKLSEFGLNERQINILKIYMKTKDSYSKLAYNLCVSVSTVKKEMADVLKIFGVKNINDLYILFLQYEILYE